MNGSWTFARKMAVVFGILVVLSAVIVGMAAYSLNRIIVTNEEVLASNVENLIDAERLRAAALDRAFQTRGFLLTGDETYRDRAADADESFAATLRKLRSRGEGNLTSRLLGIEQAMAVYQRNSESLEDLRRQDGQSQAVAETFSARLAPAFLAVDERIQDYTNQERATLEERTAAAREEASYIERVMLSAGAFALVVSIGLAVVLTRTVTRQIGTSVHHVRSSSTELQAAATQQASGAKEQASAMSEISTTITELLTTSRQIAGSAQQVASVAEQTAVGTTAGRVAVHEAERSILSIQQQVDTIVRHMLDVGKKSQQIGGILSIINELAEQTNILAINATIEASSAGEAGRRFAVVGDEVRKLAERVGGSSKQVRTLIEEMREAVNATVMVTETHSKAVDAGAQTFSRLISVFDGITKGIDTTKEVAREIELSTKQQTSAVEQVNVAISDAAQATREAEAGSSQTLQTASQLAELSDQLVRLIQTAVPARA